nr:hypothetical protein [Tanacetum cinerariifolium]
MQKKQNTLGKKKKQAYKIKIREQTKKGKIKNNKQASSKGTQEQEKHKHLYVYHLTSYSNSSPPLVPIKGHVLKQEKLLHVMLSGISILLAVGTPSTGSGNLYCQWKLSPGSGKIYILLSSTHNSISLSFDAGLMAQEEEIGRLKERVQVLEDREAIATKQSGEDAPIKGRSNNEREAAAERISNDSKEIARVLTSMDAATILAGETNVPTGSGFILTTGPLATVISTGSSQVSKSTEKANDQEAEEGILYGCDQKQLGLEVQRFQRGILKAKEEGSKPRDGASEETKVIRGTS